MIVETRGNLSIVARSESETGISELARPNTERENKQTMRGRFRR
jgi:hypothetical protein